jgi:hypothetical protein
MGKIHPRRKRISVTGEVRARAAAGAGKSSRDITHIEHGYSILFNVFGMSIFLFTHVKFDSFITCTEGLVDSHHKVYFGQINRTDVPTVLKNNEAGKSNWGF